MTATNDTPRLGCVGVGWIGRHRMQRVIDSGAARVAALCDPNEEAIAHAHEAAPDAHIVSSLEAMLDLD
ncbi:MAG: Gfo/Idh/MocA family oxidoreductase, partial [Persicimonas sp.]